MRPKDDQRVDLDRLARSSAKVCYISRAGLRRISQIARSASHPYSQMGHTKTWMTGPRSSRRLLAAIVLALFIVPTCIAGAKSESHKRPVHKPRCKPHYVAKRVRVRKREHHRLVWVRKWKCVKAKRTHAPNQPPATAPAPGGGVGTISGTPPVTNPPAPRSRDCAGTPGSGAPNYASMDACGYPSPDTTGVPAGTQLTASSGIAVGTTGAVVNALKVSGTITVQASNVTIENTEISTSGEFGIIVRPGETGTVIKNVTLHGTGTSSSTELAWGIYNEGDFDAVTADHVDFYNGERILNGPGAVTNSFCLDNVNNPGAHYECTYVAYGQVRLDHDTFLNAHSQTAAVYLGVDPGKTLGPVSVTNNLLAGGGYAFYGGANADGTGVSSETVTGNRFSRLYFSDGGEYGPAAYMPITYTWSGNIWDDTGRSVFP